jgi:hypothetical protein
MEEREPGFAVQVGPDPHILQSDPMGLTPLHDDRLFGEDMPTASSSVALDPDAVTVRKRRILTPPEYCPGHFYASAAPCCDRVAVTKNPTTVLGQCWQRVDKRFPARVYDSQGSGLEASLNQRHRDRVEECSAFFEEKAELFSGACNPLDTVRIGRAAMFDAAQGLDHRATLSRHN